MKNEILIYFGCSRSVASEFSNALKMNMALYKWGGLYEAGEEDGTVWRAEFKCDIEASEVPVEKIKNVAGIYELRIARITLYDGKEHAELFVDEDFEYS